MPELWSGKSQARGHLDLAVQALWGEVCWRGIFTISAGRGAEGDGIGRGGGELMLRCSDCGRAIEELPEGRVRCPHCGSRILFKPRPEVVRKVRAR